MTRSIFYFLWIVIGVGMTLGCSNLLWAKRGAQPPEIQIDFDFAEKEFRLGTPVPVKVKIEIKKNSKKKLWITEGFSKLDFTLEMRVIDPRGKIAYRQAI